jgi:hypothetical protein
MKGKKVKVDWAKWMFVGLVIMLTTYYILDVATGAVADTIRSFTPLVDLFNKIMSLGSAPAQAVTKILHDTGLYSGGEGFLNLMTAVSAGLLITATILATGLLLSSILPASPVLAVPIVLLAVWFLVKLPY